MGCLHPLRRWVIGINQDGSEIAKVTGIDKNAVRKMGGKGVQTKYTEIPCGNCINCRLEYAKTWAMRCILEAKNYENNEMLTLTYNDENVPKVKGVNLKTGELEEHETLVKKDVQDFLKRLRKNTGQNFRYFMCGEYGAENNRPHYHLIMYNLKVEDKEVHHINKKGNKQYTSQSIEKIWGKGYISLCPVTYETCEYVARYVIKKQKGPNAKEQYLDRNQEPEYTCMSRRPGIANDYFENLKEGDYEKKKIWIQTSQALKKCKPSRYFDKLFEEYNPKEMARIKQERRKIQERRLATILAQTDLNREEYLKVQEINALDRLKQTRIYENTGC